MDVVITRYFATEGYSVWNQLISQNSLCCLLLVLAYILLVPVCFITFVAGHDEWFLWNPNHSGYQIVARCHWPPPPSNPCTLSLLQVL
jgi:hypothetical protein